MKAKGSLKPQTNKTTYMSDKAFAALTKALEEALAFERGKCRDLSVALIKRSKQSLTYLD
ncbi:MAG TPA: hypothetical protein VNO50_07490 [Pyrinomonadaceae bacterium]|nr:hypothetical protein [Pyrinomonadaceae bacterium]